MSNPWSRPFRYWILTLVVILLAIVLWLVRGLIRPLVIAAFLAFVLNPAIDALTRSRHLSRARAITIIYLIVIGMLIALSALFVPIVVAEYQTLTVDLQRILSQVQDIYSKPVIFLTWRVHLDTLLPEPVSLLTQLTQEIPGQAFRLLESTGRNVLWILVILVATYSLLKDWDRLRDWLMRLPPEASQTDINRIYMEIVQVWRGYLRGNLALMAIVGISFTLAWTIIGVPGALILGLIAGLLTIIPELGPAIAVGLTLVVALIEGSTYLPISNFWFAVLVFGVYLGLVNIKNIWIRPRIFGRSVHMHEGIVFIIIIGAIVTWGILGALVVTPVVASAGIIGRYIYCKVLGLPAWPAENAGVGMPMEESRIGELVAKETSSMDS